MTRAGARASRTNPLRATTGVDGTTPSSRETVSANFAERAIPLAKACVEALTGGGDHGLERTRPLIGSAPQDPSAWNAPRFSRAPRRHPPQSLLSGSPWRAARSPVDSVSKFLRVLKAGNSPANHLKMLFGIFTWTPTFGLSTSCVTATLPAMLTSWYAWCLVSVRVAARKSTIS